MSRIIYTQKEKLEHFRDVAKGKKPTKKDSVYTAAEQRAYARGQRDARNEANANYVYKNGSDEVKAQMREKNRSFWAMVKAIREQKKAEKEQKKAEKSALKD